MQPVNLDSPGVYSDEALPGILPARTEGVHVMYVVNNLAVGGSEHKIVRIANALVERQVSVGIAHLDGDVELAGKLRPEVAVWCLQRRGKFSWQAARALRRLIREQRPCVLLAVNLYPTLYAAAATALLQGRPRTVGLINSMSLPGNREWQIGFYRRLLAQLDWTVYGCELQRSRWLCGRRAMHLTSRVIYNGVDLQMYRQLGPAFDAQCELVRYGIGRQSFIIGSVGRLVPEKNQAILIEVLAQLRRSGKNVCLLLAGDGRMRAALERQAAQLGVTPHVRFAGTLQDVRPALAIMDVFVLPSHAETFSNAALEAMAMGKPVILSRVGGAAEMIREGIEGFIVDPAQLRTELPRLIERLQTDAALRERLGAAARKRVERDFSMDAMVDAYQALLGQVAAGNGRGGGRASSR